MASAAQQTRGVAAAIGRLTHTAALARLDERGRAWLTALALLWALTLLASIATAAIPPLAGAARGLLALHLAPVTNPPPSPGRVLAIAAHNIRTAGWPLLLPYLGAQRRVWSRTLADSAVFASVAVNAVLVGLALGAYQARLLPYVPQLPLEWAGVAVAPADWWLRRDDTHGGRHRVAAAALVVLLVAAAVVETCLVPHR